MTDAVCASCMSPLLPHVELCFDCDLGSVAPPAVQKSKYRYSITGSDRDAPRLAGVVEALSAIPRSQAAALSRRASFDIVAELGPNQQRQLLGVIAATGAKLEELPETTDPPVAWWFDIDRETAIKLGVVTALGFVAHIISVQFVPAAAGAVACLLAAQAVRREAAEVVVDPQKADALLEPVDRRLLDQIRDARRATNRPELLALLRASSVQLIEVSAASRQRVGQFDSSESRRPDAEMTALMAQVVRMLATVDRLCQKDDLAAPSSTAYRTVRSRVIDVASRQLDQISTAVEALRADPSLPPGIVSRTMIEQRTATSAAIEHVLREQ